MKIKWIKVGDVIEVDGKKAKLKSVVEDLTYENLYTFKREDGSKFHWRHEHIYRYVMNRHIEKLENLLNKEKQRADELEAMWNDLKGHVITRSDACKERRMIRERDALIDVMAAMHDLEEEKQ